VERPATRALASSRAREVIAALSTRTTTSPAWARVVSVKFLARFVTLLIVRPTPQAVVGPGIKPVPGRWYGGTTVVAALENGAPDVRLVNIVAELGCFFPPCTAD
jgi:hypothetical protein